MIGAAPVTSSSLEAATRACNHQKSECTVDYESLNGGCTAELATGKQSNWEITWWEAELLVACMGSAAELHAQRVPRPLRR